MCTCLKHQQQYEQDGWCVYCGSLQTRSPVVSFDVPRHAQKPMSGYPGPELILLTEPAPAYAGLPCHLRPSTNPETLPFGPPRYYSTSVETMVPFEEDPGPKTS